MSATEKVIEEIKAQLENIDIDIETKTNELKELKKVRRKLAGMLDILEALHQTISLISSDRV